MQRYVTMSRCLRRWLVTAVVMIAALSVSVPVGTADTAESLDADSVLIEIDLRENGDAVWRIEYQYTLESQNESEAFEDLQADIDANRSRYTGRFADRIRPSVRAAENDTGRPMGLSNVSVNTRRQAIPQGSNRGFVTYEFDWSNFSAANDTHLTAGDSIYGFYISPKTTLIVTWPDDYEPTGPIVPGPDDRSTGRAVWEGELDFASDEPTIAVADSDALADDQPPSRSDTERDTATGDSPSDQSGGVPTMLVVAALAVGLAGAGGAVAWRRRDTADVDDSDADGTAAADSPDSTATADSSADGDGVDEEIPPELLSDEERVRKALSEHGGRMKQQELADACDWHPSKTSKVVNDLKAEDTIEVFRLGRENIVSLPEVGEDE
jgi:hypothetical protein